MIDDELAELKDGEVPEGFTDDAEETVDVDPLAEESYDTDPNTLLFDKAFGTGQTVFAEEEDEAKEFLDMFSQKYED